MCVYVQDSVADLMETVDKKPATAANRSATVCRHGQRGLETLEGILSNLPTGQVCFTNIYTGWRKGPACITMLAFKYSAAKTCLAATDSASCGEVCNVHHRYTSTVSDRM